MVVDMVVDKIVEVVEMAVDMAVGVEMDQDIPGGCQNLVCCPRSLPLHLARVVLAPGRIGLRSFPRYPPHNI